MKKKLPLTLPGNRKWPLTGGVPSHLSSDNKNRMLRVYVAGYQDGSVRMWDATCPVLSPLCAFENRVRTLENISLTRLSYIWHKISPFSQIKLILTYYIFYPEIALIQLLKYIMLPVHLSKLTDWRWKYGYFSCFSVKTGFLLSDTKISSRRWMWSGQKCSPLDTLVEDLYILVLYLFSSLFGLA